MADFVYIGVDDTSPTITYSPFGDTLSTPNLTAGWNPYFNISGFNDFVGQVGQGASMHITSLDGASLSIQWQGTEIRLYGNATQAQLSVEVDGAPVPLPLTLPDNVLIEISNRTNTNHTLSLTAHTSGNSNDNPHFMLVFGGATIRSPPPADTTENSFSLQNLTDSNVSFQGQWSFHTDQNNQSFRQSNTAGDKAQSSFLGTAFLINGRTAPDAANYSVSLDGTLRHFSAKSSFVQNNTLLFYEGGLDPTVVHQWEITNEDGSTLTIPVGGFRVFADGDPNPTSALVTSSTVTYSKGTIAALALAGILAFIVISGTLFFFLVYRPHRRRLRQQRHERREKRKKAQEAGLVLDISHDALRGVIPDSRRTSRRTGFARWKHEVEGGALGLSDIGISFRRSEEKAESDEFEGEDLPKSAKSFRFTPSPKLKSRWFGGRGNHKKEHSSPSIALELPPIYPHSRSRSDSKSPGQDASSGLTSLSYLSSPSNSVRLTTFRSQSASPALHRHPDIQFTPPQNQEPDLRSACTLESDFGSVREYDDGLSVLGAATAQAAIRGLSPRTSEMGSRSDSQASQRLPIWQSPSSQQEQRHSPPLDNRVETGSFLDVHTGSPEAGVRPRRLSSLSQSHVRFEDADSEPVKGRSQGELKVPLRSTSRFTPLDAPPLPDTEGVRSGVTSFLDFGAGSSENSIVDHSREGTQSSSGSFTNQLKSRWSSTTVPSSMAQEAKPETSSSGGSQSQSFLSVASSSPLSFPFPVSLPASPHHPEGHRPSPPSTSDIFPESQPGDSTSHPPAAFIMESPTESVPISISDLHFRQSDSEDSDPSSSSHLPRHPPLPNLTESTHGSEEDLVTPTFVVARVLGMATPSAASFAHARVGSTPMTLRPRVPSDAQQQRSSPSRHPPDP